MGIRKKRMPVSYVGKMIREAREARNLTINELVDEIRNPKVTVKLWKKWELGKEFPDLDCIYILAEKLELNPNEMLENRTRIIMESIHEVDWAKRRVGAYVFDIFHTWVLVGVKLVGLVLGFLLLYYLIAATQLMLGDQGGSAERKFVQYMDNKVEEFVPNEDIVKMFTESSNNIIKDEENKVQNDA